MATSPARGMPQRAAEHPSARDPCPVGLAVDVLSSRWTTPVLWTLHEFGRQRFVELQRRIESITPKVLTQRLRQLERDWLVRRHQYAEVPPRVEYEVTSMGETMLPALEGFTAWIRANWPAIEAARRDYDARDAG